MLHYLLLSSRSALETGLMVLGGATPIIAIIVTAWLAWKRHNEKKRKQEKDDDVALSGKLSALQTSVEQYLQFREQVEKSLDGLKQQVTELQAQHLLHQSSTDVSDLEREVERLTQRVERVADDLVKHRELVNERFLTIESYRSDLSLWTNAFDSIRQDVRAINVSIKRSKS